MIMDKIYDGVGSILKWVLKLLPDWSIDMSFFTDVLDYIKERFDTANLILPMTDVFLIITIMVALLLALLVMWAISKLIPFF